MDPLNPDRPYAGIFLSDESQAELLRWWAKVVGQPLLSEVHAHHVTLAYDPTQAQLEAIPFGSEGRVEVVGWAADEHGQAVLVRSVPASINAFPHVTVATDGTPPVYSNLLLEQGFELVQGPTLTGSVEVRT